jgi:uracil-DNA glycosylase
MGSENRNMPLKMYRQLQYDRQRWSQCRDCQLHRHRWKVVHYRCGPDQQQQFPCDLLVVGEAPGRTENALGEPFIGNAGYQLNLILNLVVLHYPATYCITNTVACYPEDEERNPRTPAQLEIETCAPRLETIYQLCQPKLVVLVGQVASQSLFQKDWDAPSIELAHPAWILRQPKEQWVVLLHQQAAKIISYLDRIS